MATDSEQTPDLAERLGRTPGDVSPVDGGPDPEEIDPDTEPNPADLA